MGPSVGGDLRKDLQNLPKAALRDGRSMLDWTEYDGLTLWWFVHPFYRTAISHALKGRPDGDPRPRKRPLKRALRTSRLLASMHSTYELLASLVGRKLVSGPIGNAGRQKILAIAQNYQWRSIRDPATGRLKKGDAFFDSILSALQDGGGYRVVTTYPLSGPPQPWYYPFPGLRTVIDKRRTLTTAVHRPFEVYWSPEAGRRGRRARKYFSGVWTGLRGDVQQYLAPLEGVDPAFIEEELAYYFTTLFGRVVVLVETAKAAVRQEEPQLVLVMTEYGLFERALVVAGKLAGVPVLAIQHGAIHPEHVGYMFARGEISESGSVQAPYVPIPDVTAVYGPFAKELLTEKSAYPEDSVVVTGQPRYDLLHHAGRIYDRMAIRRGLGISPESQVVLWTTQTHGFSVEENRGNIEAMYAAVRQLSTVQLIVKLHPGEDQRALLYRRNPLLQPVIVPGSADTVALLYACDLMITRHSTTAMEGVALDRPVIILNLSGEPDPVEYVREGVALGVYRQDDLAPSIQALLADDSPLAANREAYVSKFLYKVDGLVAERVAKLARQLVAKEKVT